MANEGDPRPTAAMLVIGDEILSGRTRDANAAHLAAVAGDAVRLCEIRVIGDDVAGVSAAVRALSSAYDLVFTSGGIGPTHDDVTADAVAAAFGRTIDVRADARALLEAYYPPGGLNAARLRMARIPEGAALIENPISAAPGFTLENVHVMAGVPPIFQQMLHGVLGALESGRAPLSWSFRAPTPEGELAAPLAEIAAAAPGVSIGCYPFHQGGFGATVVARGHDRAAVAQAAAALRAMFDAHGWAFEERAPEP